MSNCAFCGCGVPANKLMCWRHWDMVPDDLQRRVNATWRAYQTDRNANRKLFFLDKYKEARDAAVAAVRKQLERAKT